MLVQSLETSASENEELSSVELLAREIRRTRKLIRELTRLQLSRINNVHSENRNSQGGRQ